MLKALLLTSIVSTCITAPLTASGLDGKLMCGYQGWFRTPGDGTGNGWKHYSNKIEFKPGQCVIDLWPDVSELPADEQYVTSFRHADGSPAKVYSPVNQATVDIHFKWMKEYDIDGVFLQRFVVSTKNPKLRPSLDTVLENCRQSAQKHSRTWALTYDLSGLKPGQTEALIQDWKHLRNQKKLNLSSRNSSYLRHRGKPLVALWGLGFSDRPFVFEEWQKLIQFFKYDPVYGGCTVMVGVPSYWRSLTRDAVADSRLQSLLKQVDVISPWTVGRYRNPDEASRFIRKTTTADLDWCKRYGIDYLPTAFPGFSWQNLKKSRGEKATFNAIPRLQGRFLWSQCWEYRQANCKSLYVAMFDELDEGTAIFKCDNNPPIGKSQFLSEVNIPNDHYLWLTSKAAKLFSTSNHTLRKTPPARNTAAGNTTHKPNIIFIMADDLGKEWISCYGAEDIQTPHIDSLAANGIKFHNAYSMPQCTPSRVTLLTGKYPWRNGFVNHWDVPRWGIAYFDWKQKQNTTFARLMKSHGYKTFAAGKWQINDFRIEPKAMQKHGFDDWAMWTGYETGVKASAKRYQDAYINTPKGSKTYTGKFGPDVYTEKLISFMKQHKDEPMCIYFPMALTHTPLVATPDEPNATTPLQKHKAMVRYTDKLVGRIVQATEELGIKNRTITIFTTDNGSTRKITGTINGKKIKGAKGKKSEPGVCQPFIVSGPGLVPKGVETNTLTDFSDLLPTFVDLAGGSVPADITVDGVSIAPVLLGKKIDSPREWIMALGHGPAKLDQHGVRGIKDFATRVIRDKQFKVWVSNEKKITHLHDLTNDPQEKNNLVESTNPKHQAALKKFQSVVDTMPDKDARPRYTPRPPNPWDKKRRK